MAVAAFILGAAALPALLMAEQKKPSTVTKKRTSAGKKPSPTRKSTPAKKPGAPAVKAAAQTTPNSAASPFKNVKLLKNLTYQQLIELMRQWNQDLGVECTHCHAVTDGAPDFISEAKPAKQVTRQMILLVRDLNAHQKSLEGKATCYMCHHGRAVPQTQAPPYTPPPPPGAPPGG
jgi:photosynthetic reaction center cytochrome c subunit